MVERGGEGEKRRARCTSRTVYMLKITKFYSQNTKKKMKISHLFH